MKLRRLSVFAVVLWLPLPSAVYARDYEFDSTIWSSDLNKEPAR